MENNTTEEIEKGDGAPLTAPNMEGQDDLSLEEQGFKVMDEEHCEDAGRASGDEEQNVGEAAISKKGEEEKLQDKPLRQRFSGAARKRFRYFLAMGMSTEEAKKKALVRVGPSKTPKGSIPPDFIKQQGDIQPRSEKRQGIKVCILHERFPDVTLTEEQSKSIQEAIMDQILEMGSASTMKPKFYSSKHQEGGWLAVMCADQTTVDWLKDVTPTLKSLKEASLQALEDSEMPHPEAFIGFLPDSLEYSDEKILKLLEAQNDSFNVSTWKVIKREEVDSELKIEFSIDRKFTIDLKKAAYLVSYKFGQIQLWPKNNKPSTPKPESNDTKEPAAKKPKTKRYWESSGSSNWRGARGIRGRGDSSWRDSQHSRSASKGYKGASYSGSSRNQHLNPWIGVGSYQRKVDGQNMTWYGDTWKSWDK